MPSTTLYATNVGDYYTNGLAYYMARPYIYTAYDEEPCDCTAYTVSHIMTSANSISHYTADDARSVYGHVSVFGAHPACDPDDCARDVSDEEFDEALGELG